MGRVVIGISLGLWNAVDVKALRLESPKEVGAKARMFPSHRKRAIAKKRKCGNVIVPCDEVRKHTLKFLPPPFILEVAPNFHKISNVTTWVCHTRDRAYMPLGVDPALSRYTPSWLASLLRM
jgi:hypothetical protein